MNQLRGLENDNLPAKQRQGSVPRVARRNEFLDWIRAGEFWMVLIMNRAREVVVAGGGLVGLSIARELARFGFRVEVYDRATTGSEASSAAAGVLGVQSEAEHALVMEMGAASRRMYDDFVAQIESESGIEVEFSRRGILYLSFGPEDEEHIARRRAWQLERGFSSKPLTAEQVRRREPAISPRVVSAVLFPQDACVDNVALARACASAARAAGVRIHEHCAVTRIIVESGRVAGVETGAGRVACDVVINAAGAWASMLAGTRSLPVRPVRGQIVAVRAPRAPFRHALYSRRAYAVPRRDGRVLLGSTREEAGFEKNVTAGGIHQILRGALQLSLALRDLPVIAMWSGLRPATPDALPIIDRDPEIEGYILATGHYRNGILLAPITAKLVADLLRGVEHPWLPDLSVNRWSEAG